MTGTVGRGASRTGRPRWRCWTGGPTWPGSPARVAGVAIAATADPVTAPWVAAGPPRVNAAVMPTMTSTNSAPAPPAAIACVLGGSLRTYVSTTRIHRPAAASGGGRLLICMAGGDGCPRRRRRRGLDPALAAIDPCGRGSALVASGSDGGSGAVGRRQAHVVQALDLGLHRRHALDDEVERRQARVLVRLHAVAHERAERLGQVGREVVDALRLLGGDRDDERVEVRRVEGALTAQRLEQHPAEREDVGPPVDPLGAHRLLGAHV